MRNIGNAYTAVSRDVVLILFSNKLQSQYRSIHLTSYAYLLPRNMLDKLHSGSVYNGLYEKLITNPTHQLLAPIVLYFGKSQVTIGSNCFGLEPDSFTMSLFTEATRHCTDSWQMLGLVHQLVKSSAENATLHPNINVNNYHRQLSVLLCSIAEVQKGLDQVMQNVMRDG